MAVDLTPETIERLVELDRKFAREGLTFDDVLLVPAESAVLPNEVSTATRLTRKISLEIPNLSIEDQVAELDKVKRSESGMIVEPVTLPPDAPVAAALELMAKYHISGVPVTDADGRLVGILTNRDLRFRDEGVEQPVSALMTGHDLVTAPIGTTLEEARAILHRHKIEKLPVVDADGRLKGLITVKDIRKQIELSRGAFASAPRSASVRMPTIVPPRWPRQAPTCSWSTPRTATRGTSSRWCGG